MFPTIEGQEPPKDDRSVESCGFAEGDVIKMFRMPTPWRVFGMEEGFLVGGLEGFFLVVVGGGGVIISIVIISIIVVIVVIIMD